MGSIRSFWLLIVFVRYSLVYCAAETINHLRTFFSESNRTVITSSTKGLSEEKIIHPVGLFFKDARQTPPPLLWLCCANIIPNIV